MFSLKETAICVVDENGVVIREGKAFSDPEAIIAWLNESGLSVAKVGLEIGGLDSWIPGAWLKTGSSGGPMQETPVQCRLRVRSAEPRSGGFSRCLPGASGSIHCEQFRHVGKSLIVAHID
jgi:hypothetical protein